MLFFTVKRIAATGGGYCYNKTITGKNFLCVDGAENGGMTACDLSRTARKAGGKKTLFCRLQ